jgi:hypothetical protein
VDVSAIDETPATCAGTTFMTTLDTNGAMPPGTYSPTRSTGTIRWVTVAPGATSVTTSCSSSARQVARSLRIDSSRADRTSGSSAVSASSMACWGTTISACSTPSNFRENSVIASTPRSRTASQIGRTTWVAASTSKSARGRAAR